jgi:hypothetical protein
MSRLPTPAEVDEIEARAKAALTYERSEWDAAEGAYVPADGKDLDEEFKCPLCEGEGYVEGQRYDSKETFAATVVAYGIGKGLGLAEAWVENAPTDILRLVEAVRVLRNENIVLAGALQTANKDADTFREALQDIAESDCAYGDGCPPFGTRHGECTPCKAQKALKSRGVKLRYEDSE